MKSKIFLLAIIFITVLCFSSCAKPANKDNYSVSSSKNAESSENTVSVQEPEIPEFDIEKFAAENGYQTYYRDAVNSLHYLLLNETGLTDISAISQTVKSNTVLFDSIARLQTEALPSFIKLTVFDKSGGLITVNLTASDYESVKAIINAH